MTENNSSMYIIIYFGSIETMAFYQTVELFFIISDAKFKNNEMFWFNNRQNNSLRVTAPLVRALGQVYVAFHQSQSRKGNL